MYRTRALVRRDSGPEDGLPPCPPRTDPLPRLSHSFAAALIAAALPAAARAHPFGNTAVAQRLDVAVFADELRVGLVVDAPDAALNAAMPGSRTPQDWLDAFATGVTVTVDGRSVTPEVRRRDERLDLIGMHTRTFELVLAAPLDLSSPRRVEITNGNLAGQGGWYVSTLALSPSVRHLDGSLVVTPRRGQTVDLSGQWSRSELRRRLRLEVDAPGTPWRRVVDRLAPTPLTPLQAAPRGAAQAWTDGAPSAEGLGAATLLCLLVGALAGAAASRRSTGVAAMVTAAAALTLGPAPPWAIAALAALAAPAVTRRPGLSLVAASLPLVVSDPLRPFAIAGVITGLTIGAVAPIPLRGRLPGLAALALCAAAAAAAPPRAVPPEPGYDAGP